MGGLLSPRTTLAVAGLLGSGGCAGALAAEPGDPWVLVGARAPGGQVIELRVEGGRVAARGASVDRSGAEVIDAEGAYVVPGLIDSHVHLAYLPAGEALARRGVAGVVDLAAPLHHVGSEQPLEVRWSGPMITAVGGYPTTSWGAGGYGLSCVGAEACAARVDQVVAAGATVVKVPLDPEPALTDPELTAVVARAHAAGVKVVGHALTDAGAARAARLGVDALAHVPVEALSDATVAAWSDGVVVATLGAFGGEAPRNARRLHAAGATLLYGTDLGNTRVQGIDVAELARMVEAGMEPAEVLAAATSRAAAFWGMADLGSLRVGARGVVVLVANDPAASVEGLRGLASPQRVLGL